MPLNIKIKYRSSNTEEIKKIEQGDWIDLRADDDMIIWPKKKSNWFKYAWYTATHFILFVIAGLILKTGKFSKTQAWFEIKAIEALKKLVELYKKDFPPTLINLGVAMQLPKDYEAHVVLRSSSYKNFGITQVNPCAIIDNSYCGDEDWWFLAVKVDRPTIINKGDRVCQFKVVPKMGRNETIVFKKVKTLGNPNRGGHGSTGTK